MKIPARCITLLFIFLFLSAFQSDDGYIKEINDWHAKRTESLARNTGWLTLAGLFWLDEGINNFGSDISNEIVFPAKVPSFMGSFMLHDSIVTVKINENIRVTADSLLVTEMQLNTDKQENTTILNYNSLSWYIIKRGHLTGIRLKDSEHPNLKNFKGVEHYPISKNWRIKARLEKYETPKKLMIPNVLGQVEQAPCPGSLVFQIDGTEYRLDPIGDENSESYWILYADLTNEDETYGAGRFLYVDAVDADGYTYIDFNKTYNPPCVFSPFATCPLPPLQNRLNVKILSGEKMWYGSSEKE